MDENENIRRGHLLRRDAFKKMAEGHKLVGGALEIDQLHTKQSADRHFEGHKKIAEGYALLASAEEIFAEVGKTRTNSATWLGASLEARPSVEECEKLAFAAREAAKALRKIADQADQLANVMDTKPGLDDAIAEVQKMTSLCSATTNVLSDMFEKLGFHDPDPKGAR